MDADVRCPRPHPDSIHPYLANVFSPIDYWNTIGSGEVCAGQIRKGFRAALIAIHHLPCFFKMRYKHHEPRFESDIELAVIRGVRVS